MSPAARRLPELTNAGLKATANVVARNEFNEPVDGAIAVERALTIYLDKREIVTLMTLGNHPELLILGWLRNQRMVGDIEAIKALKVAPNRSAQARRLRRFLQEARILASLDHPGIVPLYALGLGEDRRPYLVMRVIHGHDFADALRWCAQRTNGWTVARALRDALEQDPRKADDIPSTKGTL